MRPFPCRVAAAQLNGDGKVDLEVANFDGGVSVLIGNGDGTFQTASFYPDGKGDEFVAVRRPQPRPQPDLVLANGVNTCHRSAQYRRGQFLTYQPGYIPRATGRHHQRATDREAHQHEARRLCPSPLSPSAALFHLTDNCGKSVAAGATCDLGITFSPIAAGNASGLLSLIDSASSKPQVIELSGMGTVMAVAPPSLNFGDQKVGTKSAPQSVVVTNQDTAAVTITSIKFLDAHNNYQQTNNCGVRN